MSKSNHDISSINFRFNKMHKEMDSLRSKIHQKEGIIFVTHVHSQDDLLNSKNRLNIESLSRQIGFEVTSWKANGNLSKNGEDYYLDQRKDSVNKLDKIIYAIENRMPTWWESFKGACQKFIAQVASNLPTSFKSALMLASRFIPGVKLFLQARNGLKRITSK